MALLEQIENMKQGGQSEAQISMTLKEQGYPLTQINEAMSQSKIKAAVYGSDSQNNNELQPSIMQQSNENQAQTQSQPVQAPQESQQQYADQGGQGYYEQPQQQYPQQGYSPDAYYSQTLDVETVRDISRQETEELIKKVKQDVEILNKSKTDTKFEIQNLDNRLTKIEAIIQELQSAIIRKMGEYGESVQGISQELEATRSAFSKMINPLLDKARESEEETPGVSEEPAEIKTTPAQLKKQKEAKKSDKSQLQKSDSASFEDYFR